MKKTLRIVLLIICLLVFCYAAYQLVTILAGYHKAKSFYDDTATAYVKQAETDTTAAAAETKAETPAETEAAPETVPITVDFDSLQSENADVVGWIYSEGTTINYPVAQGDDNAYYLHRMLNGEASKNGTIFLDAANSRDFSDDNSFLYGHNMKDDSMFHSIVEYGKQSYYDEHSVLYLLTPAQNYRVSVFAGFVTESDSWAYVLQFGSQEEKTAYLEKALESSDFESDVTPTADDCILTLSTCSYEYNNARYVLLGVLTKVT